MADPAVQRLVERIADSTGVPKEYLAGGVGLTAAAMAHSARYRGSRWLLAPTIDVPPGFWRGRERPPWIASTTWVLEVRLYR